MIIGNNFFIVDMPKSGSTFLRNYFNQYKNIELTIHHETINQNKRFDLLNLNQRIGLIRNPYAWYLSIWKWSCKNKKKSPLYSDITSRRLKLKRLRFNSRTLKYVICQITKDKTYLKKLFENPDSKKNFNDFLKILLNFNLRNIVSSDYSFVSHENLGFMTFSFFLQNVLRQDYNILFYTEKNLEKILSNINKKIYTNMYFKTENLENDLKEFVIRNKLELKNFHKIERNSTSQNHINDYFDFFSKENLLLIEKKDEFIFKKFNYEKISKSLK